MMMSVKSISCFWGSEVHQKYAMWVLVGRIIIFRIQQATYAQNLSKNTGRYAGNTNKKIVFYMTKMSSQPLWLTHFIEILLVVGFQVTTIYCWLIFL